jgi:hypothetical protein
MNVQGGRRPKDVAMPVGRVNGFSIAAAVVATSVALAALGVVGLGTAEASPPGSRSSSLARKIFGASSRSAPLTISAKLQDEVKEQLQSKPDSETGTWPVWAGDPVAIIEDADRLRREHSIPSKQVHWKDEAIEAYRVPMGRVVGYVEYYSNRRLIEREPMHTVELLVKDGELISVSLRPEASPLSWSMEVFREVDRHARSHPDRRNGWGVFTAAPSTSLVSAAWQRGHALGLILPPAGDPGTGPAREVLVPMGVVVGHIEYYDSAGRKSEVPTHTIKLTHKNGDIQAAEPVPDKRPPSVQERAVGLLGMGTETYAAGVLAPARTSWGTEFPKRPEGSREAALDAAFEAGSGRYVEMVALNPKQVQGPPTKDQTNDPTWRRASTFTRYRLHNRFDHDTGETTVTVTDQDANGVEVARGRQGSKALTTWLDSVSPFVRYALQPRTESSLAQIGRWLQRR